MAGTALIIIGAVGFLIGCDDDRCFYFDWQKTRHTNSFAECLARGYPVMESFPRRCQAGDKIFVESSGQGLDANIKVIEPLAWQELGLPAVIIGAARVFENQFSFRIKDGSGNILTEGFSSADSPDTGQFGLFRVETSYRAPAQNAGVVEVFQYSPRDGSEVDKVSVPVRFKAVPSTTLKVFFVNERKQKNPMTCAEVHSVDRRVAKTVTPAGAAIEELLRGPDRLEQEQGFTTYLNSGVKLLGLAIADGIARADFDQTLSFQVSSACLVEAVRAQIVETLMQFSTVKEVIISIEGQIEGILEP